jgi:dienelactone hydrolase
MKRLLGVFVTALSALCANVAAQQPEQVRFFVGDVAIDGWLYSPPSATVGKTNAAVVALHGCGGLGEPLFPRHADYAQMLRGAGYFVLLPDSFSPRGLKSICLDRQRKVTPGRERTQDALAALSYLASHPQIDSAKIYLLGWSNGGSTVLHTLAASSFRELPNSPQYAAAVAFYPGCSTVLAQRTWKTAIPLMLMLGGKDNWTPAAPCEALAERAKERKEPVKVHVYPEAVHDFDAPGMPLRERKGLAFTADGSGKAWVGTHEASRIDAQAKVVEFFRAHLR